MRRTPSQLHSLQQIPTQRDMRRTPANREWVGKPRGKKRPATLEAKVGHNIQIDEGKWRRTLTGLIWGRIRTCVGLL